MSKEAVIDWQKLKQQYQCPPRITLDKTKNCAFEDFLEAAPDPQVIELQTFVGQVDVRLSVVQKIWRIINAFIAT